MLRGRRTDRSRERQVMREGETAVLIHGLWMHGAVFHLMRRRLAAEGYGTQAWSYPSLRLGLADNADAFGRFLATLPDSPLHIIGHSLGAIVAANAVARRPDVRVRRLVLMGPPWLGSRCAADLLPLPGMHFVIGRSICDWLDSTRPALPAVEVGVISGDRPVGLAGLLTGLAPPHDGIVRVDETRFEGARDSITLHVSHLEMLFSASCARQVVAFLREGSFLHLPNPG